MKVNSPESISLSKQPLGPGSELPKVGVVTLNYESLYWTNRLTFTSLFLKILTLLTMLLHMIAHTLAPPEAMSFN